MILGKVLIDWNPCSTLLPLVDECEQGQDKNERKVSTAMPIAGYLDATLAKKVQRCFASNHREDEVVLKRVDSTIVMPQCERIWVDFCYICSIVNDEAADTTRRVQHVLGKR